MEHGLTLGIAYTWSKTLTNQSNDRSTETYDTYNPNLDYGPAQINQPQTFVANYVYNLPFTRNSMESQGTFWGAGAFWDKHNLPPAITQHHASDG